MGYEYGCRTRMDVVASRPGDWDWETRAAADRSHGLHRRGQRHAGGLPGAQRRGRQRKITAPHSPVVGLLRLSGGDLPSSEAAAIVLINPDPGRAWGVDPGPLLGQVGGRISAFEDVTPDGAGAVRAGPADHARAAAAAHLPRPGRGVPAGAGPARQGDRPGERAAPEGARRQPGRDRAGRAGAGRRPARDQAGGRRRRRGRGRHLLRRPRPDRRRDQLPRAGRGDWREAPMALIDNDRWGGQFPVSRNARYRYTIEAWRDLFESWRAEVMKKHDAGLDVGLELIEGRALLERTRAGQGRGPERARGAARGARGARRRPRPPAAGHARRRCAR